jgi:hypothetical protein
LEKSAVQAAIPTFYATRTASWKVSVLEEFAKPGIQSLNRVVLATDAMGMGLNIPDIKQVVQFGAPKSIESLCQRFGRCARGEGTTGEAFLIAEMAKLRAIPSLELLGSNTYCFRSILSAPFDGQFRKPLGICCSGCSTGCGVATPTRTSGALPAEAEHQ